MNIDALNLAREDNVWASRYRLFACVYDQVVWISLLPLGGVRQFRRKCIELIDPKPGERIVELCYGPGPVTVELAKRIGEPQIVASDLSPYQITAANRRAKGKGFNIDFSVQDAAHTTYPTSSFEKVVISGALHEIRSRTRKGIYEEVLRLLKPEGFFFIAEPERPTEPFGLIISRIFWFLNRPERKTALELMDGGLEQELSEAGFRIEERRLTTPGHWQFLKCSKVSTEMKDGKVERSGDTSEL